MTIEVTYDGKYPNACSGTLTIRIDGKVVYSERHCCMSTGGAGVNSQTGDSFCWAGKLIWRDTDEYSTMIQRAVSDVLDGVSVCCGGCI